MIFNRCTSVAVALAAVILTACSTAPKPAETDTSTDTAKNEPAAPSGPITGKTAYWEMYKSARTWATDIQPLRLESKEIEGMKNADGKAALWEATFGSPSLHGARTYKYAVAAHSPDIYKGVTIGDVLPWSGPTRDVMAFQMSPTIDSDAAYKAAAADAAEWLKKHPDDQASMELGSAFKFNGPVWFILWGNQKSGYAAYVNANTGAVIKGK